ncbi:hypothetical protein [Polaromonas sp.]|uniref:hypothetical protein n=1 Tax=Polaromonas sp. TaxID=1869339 RepID=UPI00286C10A5|nr:hypothetical protein [Polaromonas sp.]
MPSQEQLEVYRQHSATSEKYTYFLLAAVGAAIALCINQTQALNLSPSQTPLGLAVVLWGLSFYLGCRHVGMVKATLYTNGALLRVQDGMDPLAGRNVEAIGIASDALREIIDTRSNQASFAAAWQFRCLVLGGIAYLAWHIYEMWLRTPM